MAHVGTNEVLIVGGVGCNERLQEMMSMMVKQRKLKGTTGVLCAMDQRYCIDNGCMIAFTGLKQWLSLNKTPTKWEETTITQRFRTDQVDITYRDD